ncbi:hypothetical protein BCR32DRAFT_282178 [Anaeromyces robustus]|uniref:Uncharacterized protein n=1 Tax=Anaeromyces robustus TaxID=1754192 RepID=A0A1Y1WYA2_9FUNG|nr:hypothetical protein BCR32DRAFT_282178 [Anaeromyces robustus]|eukprot:ORX78547.1 hypothetical protein BCR32DRAFT_282178 [Anaeromyces robustus]
MNKKSNSYISGITFNNISSPSMIDNYTIYGGLITRLNAKNVIVILRKSVFYFIVLSISIVHIIISSIWIINDSIEIKLAYTVSLQEYSKCIYPFTKTIGVIFNLSILVFGGILSYINKYISEKFKENLIMPAYIYIILTFLMEVMIMDATSVVGQIYFTATVFGGILSYINKYISEKFKENLIMPAYIYIILTFLMEVMIMDATSVVGQIYFTATGTIIY